MCNAVSGGKSRKRSAASAASWDDEDPVQDAGDALDLTEDDVSISTVGIPKCAVHRLHFQAEQSFPYQEMADD